jgi:hypothetical protein
VTWSAWVGARAGGSGLLGVDGLAPTIDQVRGCMAAGALTVGGTAGARGQKNLNVFSFVFVAASSGKTRNGKKP